MVTKEDIQRAVDLCSKFFPEKEQIVVCATGVLMANKVEDVNKVMKEIGKILVSK